MNRWHIYTMLKGLMRINENNIEAIKKMDIEELREGVIEFLLAKKRQAK
ncbi:hypothetical protein [Caminicella sporogenes]|nr:hypothetical protein [Caminicella sporogenes]WIF95042.1 hypothetical protein QNI18_12390 [Caminicella sporogenes]